MNAVRAHRARGANVDGANVDGANVDGANVDGANVDGANVDGATLVAPALARLKSCRLQVAPALPRFGARLTSRPLQSWRPRVVALCAVAAVTSTGFAQAQTNPGEQPVATPAAAAAPTPEPELEREEPDLNKGVWVRGPNLPSPRQDAAVAVLAGRIYLIGGFGPHDQQMDTTLVWEPQIAGSPRGEAARAGSRLGLWTYAARIPEPVDHAAAAVVGGNIYVAGGRIENVVTNKFWRYDAGNDSWMELPSMPIPRYGPVMQAVGEKLYVIGGAISHGADATSMMVYDISTGRWTQRAYATSYERIAAASVEIDGFIAMVGGRDEFDRNLPFCDLYDPTTDRWFTCLGLHQPRSDFGLSVVGSRLVAVGGEDLHAAAPTQTMEISEPNIQGWLSGEWMPSPRHGMAQVTLGNVVWVIGGSSANGTGPSTTVLRYVSPLVKVKFQKGHA